MQNNLHTGNSCPEKLLRQFCFFFIPHH